MNSNKRRLYEGAQHLSDGDGENSLLDNFGEWLDVTDRTIYFFSDTDTELKYKADLQALPTRAIVYVRGQFGLLDTFAGAVITLGNIPLNARPKVQLKKFFICRDIELFLIIETNGDVKITCKDTDNFALPTGNGDIEEQPYYVDCFYNPEIEATVYTAHRSANFTRNNCGAGYGGTVVTFEQDYTSLVDQATAEAIADAQFNADGQAYANDPANGATCELLPVYTAHRQANFTRNNCAAGYTGTTIVFAKDYTSTVSQAAADALANANFATEGQAYANNPANGATCEVNVFVAHRQANFTRNNCGAGYTGTDVLFVKDYTSNVSQAAADALANANFATEGQAFANDAANGATCQVNSGNVDLANNLIEGTVNAAVYANGVFEEFDNVQANSTAHTEVAPGVYNVNVGPTLPNQFTNVIITVNGAQQVTTSGNTVLFNNVQTPIVITVATN